MYRLWLKLAVFLYIIAAAPAFAQYYAPFTDNRDGTTYKTVQIGNQIWFAENVKYIADDITCNADNKHGGSIKKHGCLYSWADAQKACPVGWHLPTKVEFTRLVSQIGEGREGSENFRDASFENGKNLYGFGALPAGYSEAGSYEKFGVGSYFWAATECDSTGATAYS